MVKYFFRKVADNRYASLLKIHSKKFAKSSELLFNENLSLGTSVFYNDPFFYICKMIS